MPGDGGAGVAARSNSGRRHCGGKLHGIVAAQRMARHQRRHSLEHRRSHLDDDRGDEPYTRQADASVGFEVLGLGTQARLTHAKAARCVDELYAEVLSLPGD